MSHEGVVPTVVISKYESNLFINKQRCQLNENLLTCIGFKVQSHLSSTRL
jgi:hypothetical protein